MRIPIGHGEIIIVRGDIAAQETDAIVNAANNHLWMGAGVAGALKRRGGQHIEDEAVALGPVEIGEAVATTAGALAAKRVIHAAVMGQDLRTEAEYIRKATRSSLELAEQEKLASVSFPALGTGVGGFSMHHCANIMIGEAIEFLLTAAFLRSVHFVLFDDEARAVFEEELRRRFQARGA